MDLKDLNEQRLALDLKIQMKLRASNSRELFVSNFAIDEELIMKIYLNNYKTMRSLNMNNVVYLEIIDNNTKQKPQKVRFIKDFPQNEEMVLDYYNSEFQIYGFSAYDRISEKPLEKRYLVPEADINQVVYAPSRSIEEFFVFETDNNVQILKNNLRLSDMHFMTASSLGVDVNKSKIEIILDNEDKIVKFCQKLNVVFVYSHSSINIYKNNYKNSSAEIGFIKHHVYQQWSERHTTSYETESFVIYEDNLYKEHVLKSTLPSFN